MIPTVLIRPLFALVAHMLFKGGVNDELFAYRMTGELPGKLVTVSLLMVMIARVDDLFVVLL
jgi:TRAP-type C4-dicarboxylate transport system permease large subunit